MLGAPSAKAWVAARPHAASFAACGQPESHQACGWPAALLVGGGDSCHQRTGRSADADSLLSAMYLSVRAGSLDVL